MNKQEAVDTYKKFIQDSKHVDAEMNIWISPGIKFYDVLLQQSNFIKKSVDYTSEIWEPTYKINVDCADETTAELLKQRLGENNFSISYWDSKLDGDKTCTGSGGMPEEGKPYLWQVIGSGVPIKETGVMKTFPHLYTHIAQNAFLVGKQYNSLYFPYWFIEGQAEYVAIASISNNENEFLAHREKCLSTGYVLEEFKIKIVSWDEDRWIQECIKSEQKRDTLELASHEAYSGLILFEKMLNLSSKEDIFKIMQLATEYCDFRKAFNEVLNIDVETFYKNCVSDIILNTKKILENNIYISVNRNT
jgi:hypothetical protein